MTRDRTGEWSWPVFFRGVGKALGVRPRAEAVSVADLDPWTATTRPASSDALSILLDEIERDALAAYDRQGLPTRPGHYARAPGDPDWLFVAERMGPEDRWTLLIDHPPDQGWRFATLEDLGRHSTDSETVRIAGRLLAGCRDLRDRSRPGNGPVEPLEAAVRLGAEWSGLQLDPAWREAEPAAIAKPKRLPRKPKAA